MQEGFLHKHKFHLTVIDDHDAILRGILDCLKEAFPEADIRSFTEGERFIREMKFRQIDVCVVDLSLQDVDGIELIKTIREKLPDTKIIVYTRHDEICIIKNLLELEVDGIVLKNSVTDLLAKAVQEVYLGNTYYCPHIQKIKQRSDCFEIFKSLNENDRRIVILMGQGYTSQGIADIMGYSKNTVMSYKKEIFRKFGVKTATELIAKALEYGYISHKDLKK